MFNNANVLFRTAFIDGVSTVTRFAKSNTDKTIEKENHNSLADKCITGKRKINNSGSKNKNPLGNNSSIRNRA